MTCQMSNLFLYFTMVLIWTHMLQVISQGSADMLPNLCGGAWDPHNHNSIAAISDSSLHLWDLRSMELIFILILYASICNPVVEMFPLYIYLYLWMHYSQKISCNWTCTYTGCGLQPQEAKHNCECIFFLSQVIAHMFLYFYTEDHSLESSFCGDIE